MFNILATDPVLNSTYKIDIDRIWPAQAMDTAPRTGPFLILRWEEETTTFNQFGKSEVLTVWAHQARERSTDFVPLVGILRRVTAVLTGAISVVGEDGTISTIDYQGMSPDLNDEGYKTITKNAAYKVLSR